MSLFIIATKHADLYGMDRPREKYKTEERASCRRFSCTIQNIVYSDSLGPWNTPTRVPNGGDLTGESKTVQEWGMCVSAMGPGQRGQGV